MRNLLLNLRFGLRMLFRLPGFTLLATLILAVGIGGNTAIFSIISAVFLKPLPFPEAERLVIVSGSPQGEWTQLPTSYLNYTDLKERCRTFEGLAAWTSFTDTRFNLLTKDQPAQVQYALVSSNFFSVLRVQPRLGRNFLPSDDIPGGPKVAMISHSLWQSHFAGESGIVGKTIGLDGQAYEVVGVMPAEFQFIRYPKEPDIWLPLSLDPLQGRKFSRGTKYLGLVGRLKSNADLNEAKLDLDAVSSGLAQQYPEFNKDWRAMVKPLHEQVVGHKRKAFLLMLCAVGFLLLIACANIANLLLSRATARQREMGIRAALGASRRDLVQQLLTESMLLGLLGGMFGLVVAFYGLELLSLLPPEKPHPFIPISISLSQVSIDAKVLGFTLLLSLATSLIFGLAPARFATKTDFNGSLKDGSASCGTGPDQNRTRATLVAAEMALSIMLLIGAGLLAKSFWHLQRVDPGFRYENVITADITLPRSKYTGGKEIVQFYDEALERLRNIPGVQQVGAIEYLPFSGGDESTRFIIEGAATPSPSQNQHVHPRAISAGYFKAMGIPVLLGRVPEETEVKNARRLVIINQTMAKRYWPGENPVGKRFALDFEAMRYYPNRPPEFDLEAGLREIVAVVGDVKHSQLSKAPLPEAYIPYEQQPSRDMGLVVRTTQDPKHVIAAMRWEISQIDKEQALANATSLETMIMESVSQPRFNSLLLGIFAVVATFLSAGGVYSVMAFSVYQRSQEIGVRMALGANRSDIMCMMARRILSPVLSGVGIGLISALALTYFLRSLLYGVSPLDPFTFLLAPAALVGVALTACYFPARRAVRIDPMAALRYE